MTKSQMFRTSKSRENNVHSTQVSRTLSLSVRTPVMLTTQAGSKISRSKWQRNDGSLVTNVSNEVYTGGIQYRLGLQERETLATLS